VDKALAFIDRDGLGLEIGPSHSPIAPRRGGFSVEIIDYLDADTLRANFQDTEVDVGQIEDVDFVWSGEPLRELVGGADRYDWIIASHVIEHLPDLLAFFNDCREVLKPDGVISLIIPDKRYCFDYFRPLTTIGEILDTFEQRRIRPTPGAVFDFVANCVTLDGHETWSTGTTSRDFQSIYSFEDAQNAWERAKQLYSDAHIWRFTPASFRLLLRDLRSLGLLRFRVVHEFPTAGFEFFVTLGRAENDEPLVTDRVSLLKQIDRELVEGTQTDAAISASRNGSADGLEVTPLEEKMIFFKRRVIERIRGTIRR
jgi:predicted SAM-dependent methyltransferase